MLLCVDVASAQKISCHIHPPETTGAEPRPTTIGPFTDPADCEVARGVLFEALGRCHCTGPFASPWPRRPPGSAWDSAPGSLREKEMRLY